MFAPSIERHGARGPPTNAIRPVPANAKMPYGRISSVNPAIFCDWPEMSINIVPGLMPTTWPRNIGTSRTSLLRGCGFRLA